MSKYLKSISVSDDEKKKAGFAKAERHAKLQVQVDEVALSEALSTAEEELSKAESSIPFNTSSVIEAEDKVKNIQSQIAAVAAIKERLFS